MTPPLSRRRVTGLAVVALAVVGVLLVPAGASASGHQCGSPFPGAAGTAFCSFQHDGGPVTIQGGVSPGTYISLEIRYGSPGGSLMASCSDSANVLGADVDASCSATAPSVPSGPVYCWATWVGIGGGTCTGT